jgi:hypothetical protein
MKKMKNLSYLLSDFRESADVYRGRMLQIMAWLILGFAVFFGFNYFYLLPRSNASQLCPLTVSEDGKVHGQQVLTPLAGDDVYDCSTQDIVIASDGEVVFSSYIDNDGTLAGDLGGYLEVKSLTVESGGKITADGQGYKTTDNDNITGSGGTGTGLTAGSGGGNGGAGGEGVAADPNPAAPGGQVYGNSENPVLLGSAGGNSGTGGLGGTGGGAIKITATGTVTINGIVTANGADGATDNTSSGGGGAGGSIWIESNILAGNGTVYAKGGISGTATYKGGGGGGGRIIMFCTESNTFTGDVSVAGGVPGLSQPGGVGTLLGPTCRPFAPTVLKQFKLDQTTEIPVGGATAEGQFIIAGNLNDPDTGEQLFLQVEVKELGTSFTNILTHGQATGSSNPQNCDNGSSNCGKVTINGLSLSKEYHWQARVKDSKGGFSNWVSFGNNDESARDILLAGLPVSLAITSGNNQSAVVNTSVSNALTVKVSDGSGFGVPGATVTWVVADNKVGGGLLDGASSQTNADGLATNHYRMGQRTGNNAITATSKNTQNQNLLNSPVTFNLAGLPDSISRFTVSGPTYALTNQSFDLTITAYDQYNNLKTDYTDAPALSAVLSSNTGTPGSGSLSLSSTQFLLADNGTKTISLSYNTKESIKVKVLDGSAVGYSNAIAIVDALGTCPDPDGIIDTPTTWSATLANQGIIDCRDVPEVRIVAGTTLTLTDYVTNDGNYLNDFGITILANDFVIENTAKVSSDALGYPNNVAYSRGAHGGFSAAGSVPYGSIYQPVSLGSGGIDAYYGVAGAGGGAIHLAVSGTITIDGTLSANGQYGNAGGGQAAEAGAGGSIWVETGTLAGSGTMQTNGGISWNDPGASGGRIAVYYGTNSGFALDGLHLQSYGGGGGNTHTTGGPGTVYVEHSGVDAIHQGTLLVDNANQNTFNAGVPQDNYIFSNIEVSRYGNVEFMGNSSLLQFTDVDSFTGDTTKPLIKIDGTIEFLGSGTLNINGFDLGMNGRSLNIDDIDIGTTMVGGMSFFPDNWYYATARSYGYANILVGAHGTITMYSYQNGVTPGNPATYADDYGVDLSLENLSVNSGGRITADSLGYPLNLAYSTGTYGGFSNTSSAPYGSIYEPVSLGSGGVNAYYGVPGAGGGAIHLTVSGTTTIDGTITANGQNGSAGGGQEAEAGSGGSIWLDTNTLAGTGSLQTNGGVSWNIEGASGGRIALYYATNNGFTLNGLHLQSSGGSGGNAHTVGGPGTVYLEHTGVDTVHGGTLLVDNNDQNSYNAGVPTGSYLFTMINVTRYGHVEFIGQDSLLQLTGADALLGDSTKPLIKIDGTLQYLGIGRLTVNGVDIAINGRVTGITDITIGDVLAAGMTLYAHNWYYNNTNGYVFGDLIIGQYGILTMISYQNGVTPGTPSTYADDYGVNLTLTGLNVNSGGRITADALGYPNNMAYSAGAYGGFSNSASTPYGNIYQPVSLGSGGINAYYAAPGAGGGAMHLIVAGITTVNGTITSDGQNGTGGGGQQGEAGSGGSIWLETGTIAGTGSIQTNGGTSWNIDGASGGRIAVYYTTNNGFTLDGLHLQSYGGYGGTDHTVGGPGTVYLEHTGIDTEYGGILLADNNNNNSLNAGVPTGTYLFSRINVTRYGHVEILGQDSILQLTGTDALLGDSTKPLIKIDGTLQYLGVGRLSINGVDIAINGKVEGVNDITIGDALAAGMTLYAHNWYYNNTNGYVFGDLNIGQYGIMTLISYQNGVTAGMPSTLTDDYGVNLTLTGLTVSTGGTVTANSLGYPAGTAYSRAAHGGFSVTGSSTPYGDLYGPLTLGSGGTNSYYGAPGAGGGAIRLIVNGDSVINGNITANGQDGISNSGDGGAGGSIWLTTNGLSGTGAMKTNGGSGIGGYASPIAASGGRIAVYYVTNNGFTFDGVHLQSYGGGGGVAGIGGPGTVYVEHTGTDTDHGGMLLVDNNNNNGKTAGVQAGTFQFSTVRVKRYGHVTFLGQDSNLNITSGSGLDGDASKPMIVIQGTINYLGTDILSVDGVDLQIQGDLTGVSDVTIGSTMPASVTLYSNTWRRPGRSGMQTIPYQFGNITLAQYGSIVAVGYDNGDSDYTNDYEVDLVAGDINMASGSSIIISKYGLAIQADNLSIANGASINGNYTGYLNGPGGIVGGGSYGGYSGLKNIATYGDLFNPSQPGSGAVDSTYGGTGGAYLKLNIADTLTENGTISVNGQNGTMWCGIYCHANGGGSGGSVNINAGTVNGNGSITANGGNGAGNGESGFFGGGGGGRIAIYYTAGNYPFSDVTKLQARGATGPIASTNSGPGTVYIKNSATNGDLYINNNTILNGVSGPFTGQDYHFNSVNITGHSEVGLTPDLTNSRGTVLYVDNIFNIDSTSKINGTGEGFLFATGPGKGGDGVNTGGGGGGAHGGSGGSAEVTGDTVAAGGVFYGDQTRPLTLGSGGGNSGNGDHGGNGGGALALLVPDGTVNISGIINVSGTNGLTGSPGGGGGAGGSIYILTQSCDITGSLLAQGGDGGDDVVDGGGGGGGRVSILVNGSSGTCTQNGTVTVLNGLSVSGQAGQPGTYPGVVHLPQIDAADQFTPADQQIPVGGTVNGDNVVLKIEVSNPGASVGNPKILNAQIELAPADEQFSQVLGSTLITTNSLSYSGGDPIEVTASAADLVAGEAYKWRVRVLDSTDGIYSDWSDFGDNGDNADFVIGMASALNVSLSTSSAQVGDPVTVTVDVVDSNGHTVTDYAGTVAFDYSPHADPGASLPSNYTFDGSDHGHHVFDNELSFFSPGTYTVTATDTISSSISGTTGTIIISAPEPTPTPVVTLSVTPTLTASVTPSVSPEVSASPAVSGLAPVTPTPTPGVSTCQENPLQAQCQLDVVVSNVSVATDNVQLTARVCWDTNIETVGLIRYGQGATYTATSDLEPAYLVTGHCQTLSGLTKDQSYDYRIEATSYAGNTGAFENNFVIGKVTLPNTGTPQECITIDPYSFNSRSQAIVNFKTAAPGICQVGYSNQGENFLPGKEPETLAALIHMSTLDLAGLRSGMDIVYKIDCQFTPTDNVPAQCQAMDVIPWSKAKIYFPEPTQLPTDLTRLLKDSGALIPVVVTLPLFGLILASNIFAFPRISMYALFLVRRKKKNRAWGVVYDQKKHTPVPFAVVRLYDQSGLQLIKEEVSDLEGKFGFVVDRGIYKVVVEHSEYEKLERSVTVSDPEGVVAEDFGMVKKETGLSSWRTLRDKLRTDLTRVNAILVTAGFVFAVIAFIVTPEPLNGIILILYVVQELILLHQNRIPIGTVVDNATGGRLAGAFVRLYDISEGRQLEVAMTDLKGRYRIAGKSGEYLVTAYLPGYRMHSGSDTVLNNGQLFLTAKCVNGYLTKQIVLETDTGTAIY